MFSPKGKEYSKSWNGASNKGMKVLLYKGMKVGDLQQVDVEMKDPVFEPVDHICTSQDESNFKFNRLKPDEKRKTEHLLRGHQNIVALRSREYGLTSLAEHKIETCKRSNTNKAIAPTFTKCTSNYC